MATIEERRGGSGELNYRVKIRLKGYPSESATFRRKTDAKRWAQQVEAAMRQGRYFKTAEAKRRTLAELIDRYLDQVVSVRRKGGKKLEYLLGRWRKELGDYLVADVTSARVAEVRDKLRHETTKRRKKRSPATVNRYLGALSPVFTIATREWEWAELNPVSNVQRLPEPRGRVRWLDEDERARLLAACRASRDDRLYPLVLLGISTGARRGELMPLRWRDIDLDRGAGVLHETKNGERRAIAITGTALEVMRKRFRKRRRDTDFVFVGPRKGLWFPLRPWKAAL
ncbi:MAG: tyrosine-type recombinase/integrase, partial [bacterium]|nr:tyrosine-type recombinase/integrase [bacterium]